MRRESAAHVVLPALKDAKLPGAYVNAVGALERCEKIDECKEWADRAAALASYAKQAEDDSLRTLATRIQARAIRRCGELLKQIEKAANQHEAAARARDGAGPSSRKAAAGSAGLSERQQKTAMRVASVPKARFEAEVESDHPPTVTALAAMGKKPPTWVERLNDVGRKPGFAKATRLQGLLREFSRFCAESDPGEVADAVLPHEADAIQSNIAAVGRWLGDFTSHIS